jgi:hypothetical protein
MLTSDSLKNKHMPEPTNILIKNSVFLKGKALRQGNIYEVSRSDANVLVNYGDAEIVEAPKKKAAKKKAKAKPAVDATR